MAKLKILVILGSTRDWRYGDKPAHRITARTTDGNYGHASRSICRGSSTWRR